MNIILFVHPVFLESQSMPKYAQMLSEGMRERGHSVEIWSPESFFFRLPVKQGWRKWFGYIDQYIIFPYQVKKRLKLIDNSTLFVFSDQALGPWVPLVANQAHVIHCHDFLSQKSALGEIPENKSGWSGRQYQAFIRRGFRTGKNFISVSEKTKSDLHRFLTAPFLRSSVVYNGLTTSFSQVEPTEARRQLAKQINLDLTRGYILHVGGNQWYKNRKGVVEIFEAWRKMENTNLPLLMVGRKPGLALMNFCEKLTFRSDIHWLYDITDEQLSIAYSGATVFLFPSLAEGFGWPIAEAMAFSCPVITTNEAPMTEVAGEAGFFIDRRPFVETAANDWANDAAKVLNKVVGLGPEERKEAVMAGLKNIKRFDPDQKLNSIEAIYKEILQSGK